VTVRRDGCREVLCIEHRRLRYSDRKKRWMHSGSVHRTQKTMPQWMQEEMDAEGFCAQSERQGGSRSRCWRFGE
jgi:hypothetical protein